MKFMEFMKSHRISLEPIRNILYCQLRDYMPNLGLSFEILFDLSCMSDDLEFLEAAEEIVMKSLFDRDVAPKILERLL